MRVFLRPALLASTVFACASLNVIASQVEHGPPPTILIVSPGEGTSAHPKAVFDLSCSGGDPCTVSLKDVNGAVIIPPQRGGIHRSVDLSYYVGGPASFIVEAVGDDGQRATAKRTIFVDSAEYYVGLKGFSYIFDKVNTSEFINVFNDIQTHEATSALTGNSFASISQDFPANVNFVASKGAILVELPYTRKTFTVPDDYNIDWRQVFPTALSTNRLHLLSLAWAGNWLSLYQKNGEKIYLSMAANVVKSYLTFVAKADNHLFALRSASAEHAAAMRTRFFIKFLALTSSFEEVDDDLRRRILLNILLMAEWYLNDSNFYNNNHGVMTDTALLHTAELFKSYPAFSKRILDKVTARMTSLASKVFGSEGMGDENTTGYHNYNVELYKEILRFVDEKGLQSDMKATLKPIIEKAVIVTRKTIWQNGWIPNIGESNTYNSRLTSINESSLYKESGFAVVKTDDVYLSLICGYRSLTHKQADESSITLRYKGDNIIIDGGNYSYDFADPLRLATAGQQGHSGVFIKEADSLQPPYQYFAKVGPYSSGIKGMSTADNVTSLECFYSMYGGRVQVRRLVDVFWPDEFLIRDVVTTTDGVSRTAVQRFLFDPAATVAFSDRKASIAVGSSTATLINLFGGTQEVYQGESEPVWRGWCSFQFGDISPTSGMEFVSKSTSTRFATAIKLAPDLKIQDFSQRLLKVAQSWRDE